MNPAAVSGRCRVVFYLYLVLRGDLNGIVLASADDLVLHIGPQIAVFGGDPLLGEADVGGNSTDAVGLVDLGNGIPPIAP